MPNKKKKRTILILIITAFLTVILASPFLVVKWYVEPLLIKKLDNFVEDSPHPYYKVTYQDVDIKILKGIVHISGFSLLPKSDPADIVREYNLPVFISIENTGVELSGSSIMTYILSQKMSLDQIRIYSPEITLYTNADYERSEKQYQGSDSIPSGVFSKFFTGGIIDDFVFENGDLSIVKLPNDTTLFAIDAVNIQAKNVRFDSATYNNTIIGAIL